MRTTLPAREDYYRPARARELRERASRLERWVWGPLGFYLASVPVCPYFEAGSVAGFVFLPVTLAVLGICARCYRRARQQRDEAAALEAEHQARYGALPPGEGD
jgi:hypothetical protein